MMAGMGRFKRAALAAAWTLAMLAWTAAPWAAADGGWSKQRELDQTLAEIRTVAQRVNERLEAAADARRMLVRQSQEYADEILKERRRLNVSTYRGALQISRIDFNLRLVQQIYGYIDSLDSRMAYLRSAVHTLEFWRRQVRDDQMILRTLKDADIQDVTRRAAAALEEIRAQCQRPLLAATAGSPRPGESIWNELVQSGKTEPR